MPAGQGERERGGGGYWPDVMPQQVWLQVLVALEPVW
jgi:hypothetical protein